MAAPQTSPESQLRTVQTKQGPLPDGVAEIMIKSLQVGAGTGALGAFWGAATGIAIKTRVPVLLSLASGLQWFAQGSIFYGSRHMILSRHGPVNTATPVQKVEASTIGGIISVGTVVGLMRGRSSVFPAVVIGSILGCGGQYAVNTWTASSKIEKKGDSWFNAKWSPMKKLTDREYENILEEKLLRLDAEISIIDDDIAALRTQKENQAKATKEPPQKPPRSGQHT